MKTKDESTAEEARAPAAEVNTAEHWATRAGYLPATDRSGTRNPKAWIFESAKQLRSWPEGAEVTEAQFKEALAEAATGVKHG